MARRNIRLQDFQISESDPGSTRVTCACIGHKSHQVIASGNDNKNVCLWKVSKSQALAVLKGHSSDVLSVVFSNSEEFVYSGAEGGTVFGWDLNQFKTAFSLKGHMAGCKCIAPSNTPQSIYLATGSADTNVKVWDLRRKQCVQTFKGHRAPVTTVRFSPDGRWVASGSEDGTTKIWDLQTSKKLAEFALGESSVATVRFNPQNLSLATGHADRTVKFWDLENFAHVSTTSPDSTAIAQICFEPTDGQYLFSAASESLRCWDIESATLLDNIESGWRGVLDMDISTKNELLLGLAAYGTTFSVWTTDLNSVNFDPISIDQPQIQERKSVTKKTSTPKSIDLSSSFIPVNTREPIGLNPSDFLSAPSPVRNRSNSPGSDPQSELALNTIQNGHRYFLDAINERFAALKLCADHMRRGNVPYAVHEVMRGSDFTVAVGVLQGLVIDDQSDVSIDQCATLLGLAQWLLESGSDSGKETVIRSTLTVIRKFGDFIITTLTAPDSLGVDLSKEDRRKKCKSLLHEIQKICTSASILESIETWARDLTQEFETLSRRVGNSLD